MYEAHKEMSRAVGVKKPQEAQKAKALWKMKAAKEAGEEYYDSTRKDNILGRNETRLALWREHLKDPIIPLEKAVKCVENWYWRSRPECFVEGAFSNGCCWLPPKFVGKPIWEGVWPYLDPMDSVFAHSVHGMERARKVWAAWRPLFLPDSEGAGVSAGQ